MFSEFTKNITESILKKARYSANLSGNIIHVRSENGSLQFECTVLKKSRMIGVSLKINDVPTYVGYEFRTCIEQALIILIQKQDF